MRHLLTLSILILGLACGRKAEAPAGALPVRFGEEVVQVTAPEGLVDAYHVSPSAKAFADRMNPGGNSFEYFLVEPEALAAFQSARTPDLKRYAMVLTPRPDLRGRRFGTFDFQGAKQGFQKAFGDDPDVARRVAEQSRQVSKNLTEGQGLRATMDIGRPQKVEQWELGMNGTGVLATTHLRVQPEGGRQVEMDVAMTLHMLDLKGHIVMMGLYGQGADLPALHALRDQGKAWAKVVQKANGDPWIIW